MITVAWSFATLGLLVGAAAGAALAHATTVRRVRRQRDRWQLTALTLYRALVPFVPPMGSAWRLPSGRGRWSWRCRWHNLVGGRFGDEVATSAEVLDEAREHFREQHLTTATFAAARRAVETVKDVR